MVKKNKTLWENRLNALKDNYTKLYENETPEKPIKRNYGPVKNAPHMEPSPFLSARGVKGNNKYEKCLNTNIREHTWTHMQALTQGTVAKQDQEG